ncbi:hypothetical protein [Streptomyces botrytidirepellens]|uniref:Uncharacterized protein n=1 Tax=Streptomyces botrytidirepellens TaxID=2486417 RepID=A0A3M8VMM0_9ACTN|nr:hypothetical protein [Streptomyces botrytidirepellens]RNG17655.1 hypothetical protein EEJ42_30230 [Streptomyces botrytidirepellens]
MPAATIRPRTDEDPAACVTALATVQRADRYPVHWPDDPEGWLTPDGMRGHAARAALADGLRPVLEVDSGATAAIGLYERAGWRFVRAMTADWHTADGRLAVVHAYSGPAGH